MTVKPIVQRSVVRAVSVLVSVVQVALTWHVIERVPVSNMLAQCCCTAGKFAIASYESVSSHVLHRMPVCSVKCGDAKALVSSTA